MFQQTKKKKYYYSFQSDFKSGNRHCVYSVFWQPLTVHLKSVGLKKFLVAIGMTGIVAHVGRSHLGDVQRAVISKVLPEREKVNKRERERERNS